jgi:3-hydroxyisobutyrate dehydrogenase
LVDYCPVPGSVPASPANRDCQTDFTAAMMLRDLLLAKAARDLAWPVARAGEAQGHQAEARHE